MCKLKDIIISGLQDLKLQKKKNRISFILIFLALVVYIGVNSHINSLNDSMQASLNFFESRIIIAAVPEEKAEVKLAELEELYGDDERIREISITTPATILEWIDARDILYTNADSISVLGCYEAIFDYEYKGEKRVPAEDEIIMPRYLCEVGIFDTKNLGDGDSLIGKTIKMRYETHSGMYTEEFEFKVIGTYDNIMARSSSSICIVNPNITVDLMKLQNYEEKVNEEEISQMMSEEFGEEIEFEANNNLYLSMYVKKGYDPDKVIKEVEENTNGEFIFLRYKLLDDSMQGYFNYVIQIGNIVSVMLLLISVINLAISSISEVKERKWEFALKMSMGYTRKDIIAIFFVEKVVNLVKALLLSVFSVGLYCITSTYISTNYLEYWKREYMYTVYPENVVVALVLVVIAGLIGTIAGRVSIKNINVAEELKSGE